MSRIPKNQDSIFSSRSSTRVFRCYSPRPRSGQAAVGFIFFVGIIILLISVGIIATTLSFMNAGFSSQSATAAFAAADGGVSDALLQLLRNKDFSSTGYSVNTGAVAAAVSVVQNQPEPGQITITASAKKSLVAAQIKAVAQVSTSTGQVSVVSYYRF